MFNLIPWKKHSNGGNVKLYEDRDKLSEPLALFRDEFNSLWNRFWGDWERGLPSNLFDRDFGVNEGLEDKENAYVFHAELPGFEPDEIDVNISGNSLVLRAEHKEEKKDKESSSYRYGTYQRYFRLPQGVDTDHIEAKYHSGVLEVELPKTEEGKPKRIEVSAN